MTDLDYNIWYLPFLVGIALMIASAVVYFFPPKKINYLYGYRTASSMKSQERWGFAQGYSTIKMFQAGIGLFVFSFLGLLFPGSEKAQIGLGILLMLPALVFIFFSTERALRRKFPDS